MAYEPPQTVCGHALPRACGVRTMCARFGCPADGPASPSCTRAMPQAAAVAYTASTLGAAARCSKSTSFLPLMPLSRLVARHSRMLSRSYGGRVCGAVACVWPVLTRLLSVPCLGHKNRTRGAAQGPSKPRNRQMSQPGSPRAGPSPASLGLSDHAPRTNEPAPAPAEGSRVQLRSR